MKNPKHSIPLTHDGYLKLYQLSDEILWDYDYILFDEVQVCLGWRGIGLSPNNHRLI